MQACEKNNYFLNNTAPSTHIFIMRNIVHHKNTSTNQKLLEVQLQRGHRPHGLENITLSDLGPEHVSGAEHGAERAKYSRSAARVFIQRPERSLCLAPIPLRYRSHHEPRACTNPPRIHLCLQQLTKLSAYTQKSFVVKERWSS